MKKLLLMVSVFIVTMTLTACSSTVSENSTSKSTISEDTTSQSTSGEAIVTEEALSSEESLATLSYLSAGFLDFNTPTTAPLLSFMLNNDKAQENKTVIEDELDTVNIYFDRLKGLIDNGVEEFGNVTEEQSDNELYEYKLTFAVNEEIYIIYYSIDPVTSEMTGIIVVGSVEYVFEVVDNMKVYKYQENEKKQNGNNVSNTKKSLTDSEESSSSVEESSSSTEVLSSEETSASKEESKEIDNDTNVEKSDTKMMLIAHNGDDYIKVIYKTETEDNESTTKFLMEQSVAGVKKETALKISMEENEYKITMEDNEDRYMFKQEIEDNVVKYKLNYTVGGVTGMVKITQITDELGNVTYDYHITEANKEKDIKKQEPKSKGFDSDDESEDDSDI